MDRPDTVLPQGQISPIEKIADLLRCPACGGQVDLGSTAVACRDCSTAFPVQDGIPILSRPGSAATWGDGDGGEETSEAYQRQYEAIEEAAEYNEEYREKLFKRWSTQREFRLLDRLLGREGPCSRILDLPCGGGRLSPRIARHAELIIEADIALGQVLYGLRHAVTSATQVWLTASAFHIPLRDAAVDGAVCCRLNHHLPSARERERLLEELMRVSRRFVIMTFFDHYSLKNTLRRVRRPFDGKPPKHTMSTRQVAAIARRHGAELVACPPLSRLSSGHRYALIEKRP